MKEILSVEHGAFSRLMSNQRMLGQKFFNPANSEHILYK